MLTTKEIRKIRNMESNDRKAWAKENKAKFIAIIREKYENGASASDILEFLFDESFRFEQYTGRTYRKKFEDIPQEVTVFLPNENHYLITPLPRHLNTKYMYKLNPDDIVKCYVDMEQYGEGTKEWRGRKIASFPELGITFYNEWCYDINNQPSTVRNGVAKPI